MRWALMIADDDRVFCMARITKAKEQARALAQCLKGRGINTLVMPFLS